MSLFRTAAFGLLFILIFEAGPFAPNFRMFYCGDSLYYCSRVLHDWFEVRDKFAALDGLGQYRPVTSVFYSLIVHPLARLDLYRQHVFPPLFHGLNTLLVLAIGRRLFPSVWQAPQAAVFFGVSTTGAYITYDHTFLPDCLYAFFYFSALLMLRRATEKKGETVTIEAVGGEGMELDCRYVLNSRGPIRTVYGWITADHRGRQTLVVNTPGHYVISAIRNSLRSDWVPVYYGWDCLNR
jgi:hypothetical protein